MRVGLYRFMDQLDEKAMQVLKNLLIEMRAQLKEQIKLSNPAVNVVKLDQTSVGRVSRIDAIQHQAIAVALQNKAKQQILNVNKALEAMEVGDYGFCVSCGQGVSMPRLLVRPEANLCLSCQDISDKNL